MPSRGDTLFQSVRIGSARYCRSYRRPPFSVSASRGAPLVLQESGDVHVRLRLVRLAKCLLEGDVGPGPEVGQRRERVDARQRARESDDEIVVEEIDARLQQVRPVLQRYRVGQLYHVRSRASGEEVDAPKLATPANVTAGPMRSLAGADERLRVNCAAQVVGHAADPRSRGC